MKRTLTIIEISEILNTIKTTEIDLDYCCEFSENMLTQEYEAGFISVVAQFNIDVNSECVYGGSRLQPEEYEYTYDINLIEYEVFDNDGNTLELDKLSDLIIYNELSELETVVRIK